MADKDQTNRDAGRRRSRQHNESFRERLGNEDIKLGDYKVDDLRKIASEFSISGSHGMNKEELVETINKTRRNQK